MGNTYDLDHSLSNIADPLLIIEITDETNWAGGIYSGSIDGLSESQIYLDLINKLKYFFDGTTLVRSSINDIEL